MTSSLWSRLGDFFADAVGSTRLRSTTAEGESGTISESMAVEEDEAAPIKRRRGRPLKCEKVRGAAALRKNSSNSEVSKKPDPFSLPVGSITAECGILSSNGSSNHVTLALERVVRRRGDELAHLYSSMYSSASASKVRGDARLSSR